MKQHHQDNTSRPFCIG